MFHPLHKGMEQRGKRVSVPLHQLDVGMSQPQLEAGSLRKWDQGPQELRTQERINQPRGSSHRPVPVFPSTRHTFQLNSEPRVLEEAQTQQAEDPFHKLSHSLSI